VRRHGEQAEQMGSAADQQRHAEEILREFLSESLRCRSSWS
jgi:hypothetical protein